MTDEREDGSSQKGEKRKHDVEAGIVIVLMDGPLAGTHLRSSESVPPDMIGVRGEPTRALLYTCAETDYTGTDPLQNKLDSHVAYRFAKARRYAPTVMPKALVFDADTLEGL